MNTFLQKISQLTSVCDVTLLSSNGEVIFLSQKYTTPVCTTKKPQIWNTLIAKFNHPETAEFIFAKGRYYLQQTDIGYLIIGMQNDSELNKLKIACTNVKEKLSNAPIRKQTLLKMLREVDDEYKPHIIKELMATPDGDVAKTLLFLLKNHIQETPVSESRLLTMICQALGHCSSYEALSTLTAFLATCASASTPISPTLEQAIRISIQQLKQSNVTVNVTEQPATQQSAQQPARPETSPSPYEQQAAKAKRTPVTPNFPECQEVTALLRQNKKDQALSTLLELITTSAKKRNFQKAEELRDWLIEIDAMALNQIIRSADIIEEEKKASISKQHLGTWKQLIHAVSAEAFSAIFHSSSLRKYGNGDEIVKQGDIQSTLYFVNSGKVLIHAKFKERSESITTLEEGSVFGVDTFFEVSVWTVSAKSLGAELIELPYSPFSKLRENYPALEAKLQDYCKQFQSTKRFFDRTRKNRRKYPRKAGSNRVTFVPLNDNGSESGKNAKGDLLDISQGGLSLSFHASQKQAAADLLAKNVNIAIQCGLSTQTVKRTGTVKAIGGHDPIGNRYSMHVEFQQPLTNGELQRVLSLSNKR